MIIIKSCPKCGFSVLIQQIDFETMSYFFVCVRCDYAEFNE
jgi:ribosomal protein S27AE